MNLGVLERPLERQREHLRSLLVKLRCASSIKDKIEALNALSDVDAFFSFPSLLKTFLSELSLDCEYVVKQVFAIGQGKRLFEGLGKNSIHRFFSLVKNLLVIEAFYQDLGGIIGYQHLVLTLLTVEPISAEKEKLMPPEGKDLNQDSLEVRRAIIEGIKCQGKTGELYPVGGVADRLQLRDEKTEERLPAARLIFLGKPLLEGVISDLQAREYLHYKLFGAQITTPIGMMTSSANRNHEHIHSICVQNRWFGRHPSSFKLFKQPLVPTFTKKGEWCLQKPLKLLLKPGGHGMLWKLLKQSRGFEWFKSLGVSKVLVRQINNPMAAIDCGLLAFLGIGHEKDRAFGFASCPRLVNAHEGMNVIKEVEGKQVLTNIEYCDFEKCGIQDKPIEIDGKYSRFPSNTNILFADLEAVKQAVEKVPNPGLLINFRKGYHYHNQQEKEEVARLETTMQNIADAFVVEKGKELSTYLTFYERRKTISTTKKKLSSKEKMLETPEGCYYDYMLNASELLRNHCQVELPPFPDAKTFLREGPSFLFSYHPALGPLYSIIGQKIQGGRLYSGSELQLELADLELTNLSLKGSLLIHATAPVGHFEKGILNYSSQTGRCHLKNVQVVNKGIDWEENHSFWKDEVKRAETLKIILHGHSEFFAEDLKIEGNLTLEIPHGMSMRGERKNGRVTFTTKPLNQKKPFWVYSIDSSSRIKLARN